MIRIKNVSVTYKGSKRQVEAVRDVSLELERGKVTSLVGESGSGKSTLLMAIPSLLPPEARLTGSITIEGRELVGLGEQQLQKIRWDQIALVPQGAMNSFTPVMSIGAQIDEVLAFHLGLKGRKLKDMTGELLGQAGLSPEFSNRYPHELSGGQKQRAAIAMALACSPPFLLADEPTTALDVITQSQLITTLVSVSRERSAGLLLVTHDIALATCVSDNIAVMKDGIIVESGPPSKIVEDPREEHTKLLVGSLKEIEGRE